MDQYFQDIQEKDDTRPVIPKVNELKSSIGSTLTDIGGIDTFESVRSLVNKTFSSAKKAVTEKSKEFLDDLATKTKQGVQPYLDKLAEVKENIPDNKLLQVPEKLLSNENLNKLENIKNEISPNSLDKGLETTFGRSAEKDAYKEALTNKDISNFKNLAMESDPEKYKFTTDEEFQNLKNKFIDKYSKRGQKLLDQNKELEDVFNPDRENEFSKLSKLDSSSVPTDLLKTPSVIDEVDQSMTRLKTVGQKLISRTATDQEVKNGVRNDLSLGGSEDDINNYSNILNDKDLYNNFVKTGGNPTNLSDTQIEAQRLIDREFFGKQGYNPTQDLNAQNMLENSTSKLQSTLGEASDTLESTISSAKSGVQSALGEVSDTLQSQLNVGKSAIQQTTESLLSSGETLSGDLQSTIASKISSSKSLLEDAGKSIKSKLAPTLEKDAVEGGELGEEGGFLGDVIGLGIGILTGIVGNAIKKHAESLKKTIRINPSFQYGAEETI